MAQRTWTVTKRLSEIIAGVALVLAALAPPALAGASPALAGASPALAQIVPGTIVLNQGNNAQVNSVSCSSAGNCAAGGSYADSNNQRQAFVVVEVNGVWGPAQEVAGALNGGGHATVASVSCSSAGNCAAGGSYADSNNQLHAFVIDEVNGAWGPAQELTGPLNVGGQAQVTSVSCSSAGFCAAGGEFYDDAARMQAFVIDEMNGTWGTAQEVAGLLNGGGQAQVNSVSCSSAGTCVAGGEFYDDAARMQAFVIDEMNGGWGPAQEVAGPLNVGGYAQVNSVSCSSAGNCAAGGQYSDSSGNQQAFVVDEVNGVWGNAQAVASSLNVGGYAQVSSVSCSSAGDCVAGGWYQDGTGNQQAFVVDEVNGVWGNAQEVATQLNVGGNAQVTSVSCSSVGTCTAGGTYLDQFSELQSFFVQYQGGAWGAPSSVPGISTLIPQPYGGSSVLSVSCPAGGTCAMGGEVGYFGEGSQGQAWVLGSQATASAPLHVAAVRGVSWLRATWSAVPGALGYECTLMNGIDLPSTFHLRTPTPSCTFLGLDRTTAFGVSVSVVSDAGTSAPTVAWPALHRVVCARAGRQIARVGVYPICPAGFRTLSDN